MRLSLRNMLLAGCVLGVLSALSAWLWQQDQMTDGIQHSGKLLPRLSDMNKVNQLDRIEINFFNGVDQDDNTMPRKLVFEKQDSIWIALSHHNYGVYFLFIQKMITSLAKLERLIERKIQDPLDYLKFSVPSPEQFLTLSDEQRQNLFMVEIKLYVKESMLATVQLGFISDGQHQYARLEDGSVWQADGVFRFGEDPIFWAERSLAQIDSNEIAYIFIDENPYLIDNTPIYLTGVAPYQNLSTEDATTAASIQTEKPWRFYRVSKPFGALPFGQSDIPVNVQGLLLLLMGNTASSLVSFEEIEPYLNESNQESIIRLVTKSGLILRIQSFLLKEGEVYAATGQFAHQKIPTTYGWRLSVEVLDSADETTRQAAEKLNHQWRDWLYLMPKFKHISLIDHSVKRMLGYSVEEMNEDIETY